MLEDCGLLVKEKDAFESVSRYRITEPLISFYQAVMRPEWTDLGMGRAREAWERSRQRFLSMIMESHFQTLCREFALRHASEAFTGSVGEVAPGTVAIPSSRKRIQVDVAVLGPASPNEPRAVRSLGEAKWDEVLGIGHLQRLRRARDLLAAKGYDTSRTVLACYSGAGFDERLQAEARKDSRVLLVDLPTLYG
nr:hypothetical protein GCM10020093_093700 [Planobispora longispora]